MNVETLQQQVAATKENLDSAKAQSLATADVRIREAEIEHLTATIELNQARAEELAPELKAANDEVRDLEGRIQALQKELFTARRTRDQVSGRVQSFQWNSTRAKARRSILQEEVAQLRERPMRPVYMRS